MLRTRHVSVDGAAALAGLAHAAEPDAEPRGVDGALPDSLDVLTQPQRTALVPKAVKDMRDDDVAHAMSLPLGTVKCHAHRGKLLAARLRRTA